MADQDNDLLMPRLHGYDAITSAEERGIALHKYEDPIEGARDGISLAEARQIAKSDPGLIWLDVEAADMADDDAQLVRA